MDTTANVSKWTPLQVQEWLQRKGLQEASAIFQANTVNGEVLLQLNEESLLDFEIEGDLRSSILMEVAKLKVEDAKKDNLGTSSVQPPQMSGYLWKQGGNNNNKGWRRRYVVLENNALRYFRAEQELAGIIYVEDMKLVSSIEPERNEAKYRSTFALDTNMSRRFLFCADSDDLRSSWVAALQQAIAKRRRDPVIMTVSASYQAQRDVELSVTFGQLVGVIDEEEEQAIDGTEMVRVRLMDGPNEKGKIEGFVPRVCVDFKEDQSEPTQKISMLQRAKSWSPRKPSKSRPAMIIPKPVINRILLNITTVHSGWLEKQGDILKSWKRRWVVLTSEFCLYIYKVPTEKDPIDKYPLPSFNIGPIYDVGREYAFKAAHPGLAGQRPLIFCAETENEMKQWINVLVLATRCELPSDEKKESEKSLDVVDDYKSKEIGRAIVIQEYIPNAYDKDALPLNVADYLSIQEKDDSGWWKGVRESDKRVGFFPHRYVQELDVNTPEGSRPSSITTAVASRPASNGSVSTLAPPQSTSTSAITLFTESESEPMVEPSIEKHEEAPAAVSPVVVPAPRPLPPTPVAAPKPIVLPVPPLPTSSPPPMAPLSPKPVVPSKPAVFSKPLSPTVSPPPELAIVTTTTTEEDEAAAIATTTTTTTTTRALPSPTLPPSPSSSLPPGPVPIPLPALPKLPLPPPPPTPIRPPTPTPPAMVVAAAVAEPQPQPKAKPLTGRAIYRCEPDVEDELSFAKGDIIEILPADDLEEGWLMGSLRGRVGLVPENYIVFV